MIMRCDYEVRFRDTDDSWQYYKFAELQLAEQCFDIIVERGRETVMLIFRDTKIIAIHSDAAMKKLKIAIETVLKE